MDSGDETIVIGLPFACVKVLSPFPSRIVTVPLFPSTAKSCLPSPLKSPTATTLESWDSVCGNDIVDELANVIAVPALDSVAVPNTAFALLVSRIDTVPVGAIVLLPMPVTCAVNV